MLHLLTRSSFLRCCFPWSRKPQHSLSLFSLCTNPYLACLLLTHFTLNFPTYTGWTGWSRKIPKFTCEESKCWRQQRVLAALPARCKRAWILILLWFMISSKLTDCCFHLIGLIRFVPKINLWFTGSLGSLFMMIWEIDLWIYMMFPYKKGIKAELEYPVSSFECYDLRFPLVWLILWPMRSALKSFYLWMIQHIYWTQAKF